MKVRCTSLLVLLMTVYCSFFTVNTSVAFSKEELNTVFASLLTKSNEMGGSPISISSVSTPPTCWGGGNGAINITVSGGSAPYTYSWSTGVTTEDISGLVAGNYSVTVHDVTGAVATSNITVNPAVQIVGYMTCNRVCYASCNGVIDLTLLSGAAPFTYHWSTQATTQDVTGLCAGVYTVTVTDVNGCTKLFAGQILAWPQIILSSTKVDLTCNAVCNGSIDLTVSGGTSPYTYNWSNGATTQDVSGLCAGTYSVTVTDFNGCTKVNTKTILQPPALNLNLVPNQILCYGACTGTVDATVTGGTPPYSYSWSNGATTEDLNNVCAGSYSLTVTDANGCPKSGSTTITQPTAALNATTTTTPVICSVNCSGAVDLTVTGGTAPYSYSWSNGATSQDLSGICEGTFCVTVTDANQCTTSTCATVTHTVPPVIVLTPTNLVCYNACAGAVNLTVVSGSSPYSYNWSNGATTEDISGLCAGTYCVTVTDVNGCTAVSCATVNQPQPTSCSVTGENFCQGQSSQLCASTGASYLWSTGATTQCITVTTGGTYSVVVTNATGCTSYCEKTVVAYPLPTCEITGSNFCQGQSTQLCSATASSYMWSTGATTQCITVTSGGTYSVTVTNANGCTSSCNKTVVAYELPTCSITGSDFCEGQSSTWCAANSSSYLWSTGATTQCITVTAGPCVPQTYVLNPIADAQPGFHDNYNSANQNYGAVTFFGDMWQPGASGGLNGTRGLMKFDCSSIPSGTVISSATLDLYGIGPVGVGAAASVGSTGANTSYLEKVTSNWSEMSVTWNTQPTHSGIDSVILPASSSTTQDYLGIDVTQMVQNFVNDPANNYGFMMKLANENPTAALFFCSREYSDPNKRPRLTIHTCSSTNGGNSSYSVIVTNANGCTSSCERTPVVYPLPECSITGSNFCQGQSTQLCSATASSYNWSTGATTQCITVTTGGTYSVTVTNANGCTSSCSKTVVAYELPVCSITGGNFCQGQSTQLCAATNSSYLWSTGATSQCITVTSGGTYSVTVTNANGCTSSCSKTVVAYELPVCSITGGNFCQGQSSQLCAATNSSYLWSTGATTQCITVTSGGTYSVTVTNANGCTSSCSKTVVAYELPQCSITGNNFCQGQSSQLCAATASSYNWSTGATTQCITVTSGGTYSVTVTNANGCTSSCSKTVTAYNLPQFTISSTNVTCYGSCNGTASVVISGGAYSYSWSNGSTNSSISGLCPNTYCVTVTNSNGCTASQCVTITQPAHLQCYINCTNLLCYGDHNAAADLTVVGGTAPFTYHWTTGATTEDVTGLAAGIYCVTTTDANGCTTFCCVQVNQPTQLNATATGTNLSCYKSCNGTALVSATGGSTPYSYYWSTGSTSTSLSGLCAGTYCVTVYDSHQCSIVKCVTLTQPDSLYVTFVKHGVTCNGGNDGYIDITVVGGTAPFGYVWSNGATTQDVYNLIAGGYCVTVTDAHGCVYSRCFTIMQPLPFTCSVTGSNFCQGQSSQLCVSTASLYLWSTGATTQCITVTNGGTYSVTVTNAAGCTSSCSKTIQVYPLPTCAITGGNFCQGQSSQLCAATASSYLWSTGATSQCITVTSGGTYSVTVTNALGCTSSCSKTVVAYELPQCSITGNNFCQGQSTQLCSATASSYMWSTGATTQCITVTSGGTYSVTVTNANGCTSSCSKTVVAYELPQCSITGSNFCQGQSTQLCSATASSYMWSTGATTQCITVTSGGTYSVTVTNANGCTSSCSKTVVSYELPQCSITGDNFCYGGSTQLCSATASSYLWSTGATTQCITVTTGGTYSVTVTNANGCTSACEKVITQYQLPACTITGNNFCYGQSSQLCAATASSYLWSTGATSQCITVTTGGTYSVTVTNANGCTTSCSKTIEVYALPVCEITGSNFCQGQSTQLCSATASSYMWSTGATTQCITVTSGGTYSVTVTNANGCTSSCSKTVVAYELPQCSITGNNFCYGQSSQLCAATASSYNWSTGATTQCITVTTGGTYSVTVTNANGCTSSCSKTIEVYSLPEFTINKTDVTCYGACNGTATVVINSTAPFSYSWSTGSTNSSISGLCPDTYCVTVTNANGCTTVHCVEITQPTLLQSSATSTNVTCYAACNGTASVTPTGGTAPYSYYWSNGGTDANIINLCPGTYCVTVTDANGCTSSACATVTEPDQLLCIMDCACPTHTPQCHGDCTGMAMLTVYGGTAPFTYNWSNGSTDEMIDNLCEGFYCVTVTDANGCTCEGCILIQAPPALEVSIQGQNSLCAGTCNGSATVTATGGTAPYTYNWYNGSTDVTVTGLCTGNYCVTVTDAHGCTAVQCVDIESTSPIQVSGTAIQPSCYGMCNGSVDLTVTGGAAPYVYNWANGATTEDLSGVCAGSYCVTVTDANGCTGATCVEVGQPTPVTATTNQSNVSCYGMCNGTASVTPAGGTAPYSYVWYNGSTGSDISGLCAGQYCVTVYDAHQCPLVKCVTITQPEVLTSSASATNATCYNACNGTASVTPTGGTAPYSYYWSNGGTDANIINLCPNTYCVTVTDANGCTSSSCTSLTEPDQLLCVMDCSCPTFTPQCHGDCTGMAMLTVYGGTAPYTYAWSNGSTAEMLENLCAGFYCVTVTDANGCTCEGCLLIEEPTAIDAGIIGVDATVCQGITCNGSADLTVTGGTQPYAYAWSNGATTEDLTALCSGSYSVTVTDAHGCTQVASVTINCTPPPPPPCNIITVMGVTQTLCYGSCNGAINLTALNATAPVSYAWSNGATTEDISSLCAGNYSVIVTDFYGCTATNNATVNQNTQIVLTTSSTNSTSCNSGCCNGSASVTATGGIAPYTYHWSNNCTNSAIANKCPGTYCVTVTDHVGCTQSTCVTISCTPPPSCSGFRTQTQGGWGAVPNGGNPGVYMTANFAAAFPSGLTVGGTACSGSHWLKLTTAQAVTDFLPSGGTPTKLLQNWTNPGGSLNNTLAGQVVAAALSIGFDNYDANFSSNATHLKDLYYNSGTFSGWTVQQVFNEANKKLAGCYSAYSYSVLTNALDQFNNNYDGGTVNLGKLSCTCPGAKNEGDESLSLNSSNNAELTIGAYPNPLNTQTTIEFVSNEDLNGTLEVFNVTGVKIAELYNGAIVAGQKYSFNYNAEDLAAGMYFARLSTNKGTAVQNIVKIQ